MLESPVLDHNHVRYILLYQAVQGKSFFVRGVERGDKLENSILIGMCSEK